MLAIVVHVESGGTWTQVGADIDGDMGGRSRTSALPIRYVPLSLLLILFFARSLTAQVVKLPLSLGDHFTCVILDDLSLKCFGRNTLGFGMLGLGTDGDDRGDNPGEMGDNLPTVDLGSGRLLMSVASGIDHSCAILDDLTLKCWGRNDMGMLGLGDTNHRGDSPGEMGDSLPTVDVGSGKTVNRVSASYHTCVILDDSSVKCWGRNGDGWLGYGDTLTRGELPNEMGNSLPVVNLGENMKATDISLGLGHTCALLHDTSVKCWGRNNLGQLGDGTLSNKYIPTLATEVSAKSISCGGDNTCAILTDDSVKCWGGNSFGDVSSMKAKAIALGLNHLCLILLDGSVWCSDIGSVDLGTGRTAKQISSGKVHTCVVLDDNLLACWGLNADGQLGLGDTSNRWSQFGNNLPIVDLGTGRTVWDPAQCNSITAPLNGGVGDCPSSLPSGSTCQPTCDEGYIVSGLSSCSLGTLTTATCDPAPCDTSSAPENGGVGDCPSSLPSGSTCQPTCDEGYIVSGLSSCSLGTLTTATCSANSCTASSLSTKDGTDGNFYCINGGTVGGTTGSCTCTSCNEGYGGASCETAGACSTSTDPNKDGADGSFYCINGGTVGGTAGSGSCTCTVCNTGYEGASCQTASACTASAVSTKDGSDGTFYCINGGTVGGTTGPCTCTGCDAGYSGTSCETAGACSASSNSTKDGSDSTFYCINGGTVGGTVGSCTCTSCDAGYEGASCQTVITPLANMTLPPPPPTPPSPKELVLDDDDHAAGLAGILVALATTTFNMLLTL